MCWKWAIGGRKSSFEEKKSFLAVRKAQLQYKKTLEQIAFEVNTIYSEVALSEREVHAASIAQEAYGKVLEREMALFDLSRLSNQRILDSQDDYYDSKRTYLRALLNLHLSLMKLQWAQGVLLDVFEINA